MINIEVVSALWGAMGISGAYLLGWAVKALFLDPIVLPRVLDWWARQTRKGALGMAEKLLKRFELELRLASDIRHLILRFEQRSTVLILLSGIFNTLLILMLLADQRLTEDQRVGSGTVLLLLMIPALYTAFIYGVIYDHRRNAAMFLDLHKYREEIVIRLKKLIAAAGLDDDAAKVWASLTNGGPH